MAKNNNQAKVTVDEKKLQSIMAGDYSETPPATDSTPENKDNPPHEDTDKKPKRKKSTDGKSAENYSSVFLQKRPVENRKQTTVGLDNELVKKIQMLLGTQTNGITISSFVNNILLLHVEKYKEAINEIYENSRNTLF